jgi:hypothetical protein
LLFLVIDFLLGFRSYFLGKLSLGEVKEVKEVKEVITPFGR